MQRTPDEPYHSPPVEGQIVAHPQISYPIESPKPGKLWEHLKCYHVEPPFEAEPAPWQR